MEYIKIVNQDNPVLDTEIKIETNVVVAGSSLSEFDRELKELIDKYRI